MSILKLLGLVFLFPRLDTPVLHSEVDNNRLLAPLSQLLRLRSIGPREDTNLQDARHALQPRGQGIHGPQALGRIHLILLAVEQQGREWRVDDVIPVVRDDVACLAGEPRADEGLAGPDRDELAAYGFRG